MTKFIVAEMAVECHKPAGPPVRGIVLSLSAVNSTRVVSSVARISHNILVFNEIWVKMSKYGVRRSRQTETLVADDQCCR